MSLLGNFLRFSVLVGSLFFLGACDVQNSFSGDTAYLVEDPKLASAIQVMSRYHCFNCHAWSSYTTSQEYLNDSKAGGNISPGDGAHSNLYKLVKGQGGGGGNERMPPSGSLMSDEEATIIEDWIDGIE